MKMETKPPDLRQMILSDVLTTVSEVSVYRATTRDDCCLGHAIAVVAFVIGGKEFDSDASSRQRKSIPKRKGGTVKLDAGRCESELNMQQTPDGCTTLHIGRDYHWDIVVSDGATLEIHLIEEELAKSDAIMVMEPNSSPNFSEQAQVVLHSVKDSLNRESPEGWEEVERYVVQEQVLRLRRLADAIGFVYSDPTTTLH